MQLYVVLTFSVIWVPLISLSSFCKRHSFVFFKVDNLLLFLATAYPNAAEYATTDYANHAAGQHISNIKHGPTIWVFKEELVVE